MGTKSHLSSCGRREAACGICSSSSVACFEVAMDQAGSPDLSEKLIARHGRGYGGSAAGRSIAKLERLRMISGRCPTDSAPVQLSAQVRRCVRWRSVCIANALVADPRRRASTAVGYRGSGRNGYDYNHHMTDFDWAKLFGDAMDALYRGSALTRRIGRRRMYYSVESHIRHLGKRGRASRCT